jgi:hypothetical protein
MPSKTFRLIRAAERGDFRQVASLLQDGAPVNGLGKDSASPLLSAVRSLDSFAKRVVGGRLVRFRTRRLRRPNLSGRRNLSPGMLPSLRRRSPLPGSSKALSRPGRARRFVGAWQDCYADLRSSDGQDQGRPQENQTDGGRCLTPLQPTAARPSASGGSRRI